MNFLRASETYVQKATRCRIVKNLLVLTDIVVDHLERHIVKRNLEILHKKVGYKGFDMRTEKLKCVYYQILLTWYWLRSESREGKQVLLLQIEDLEGCSSNFLKMGINCMKKDGIYSWEQAQKMLTPGAPVEDFNDLFFNAEQLLRKVMRAQDNPCLVDDIEAAFSKLKTLQLMYAQLKKESAELLDEAIEKSILLRENEYLKKQLKQQKEEASALSDLLEEVLANIEHVN